MYLTYKAKITSDKKTEAILENLCFSATKLYNTVNYYLRSEWEQSRAEYEMNLTQYRNWEHHFGYENLPYEKPKIPLNRQQLPLVILGLTYYALLMTILKRQEPFLLRRR